MVERAIQEIQGHIRATKFQLEKKMGCKVDPASPIWPWVIDYAAKLFRTCHVHGSDGKTTTQRLRGDVQIPDVAEFAETAMWKPAKQAR